MNLLVCFAVITMAWDAGDPVNFYRVYDGTTVIATTTATMINLTLTPGPHSISVTGVTTNETDPSNTYFFPSLPSPPTGLTVITNAQPTNETMQIQAEAGTLVAPMEVVTVSGAIGQAVQSPTANNGFVTFLASLSGGNYVVWARVMAPNSSSDSFFVSVDGANEDIFGNEDLIGQGWVWKKVTGGNTGGPLRIFNLPAGVHSFRFRAREPMALLDAIYITSDMAFVP